MFLSRKNLSTESKDSQKFKAESKELQGELSLLSRPSTQPWIAVDDRQTIFVRINSNSSSKTYILEIFDSLRSELFSHDTEVEKKEDASFALVNALGKSEIVCYLSGIKNNLASFKLYRDGSNKVLVQKLDRTRIGWSFIDYTELHRQASVHGIAGHPRSWQIIDFGEEAGLFKYDISNLLLVTKLSRGISTEGLFFRYINTQKLENKKEYFVPFPRLKVNRFLLANKGQQLFAYQQNDPRIYSFYFDGDKWHQGVIYGYYDRISHIWQLPHDPQQFIFASPLDEDKVELCLCEFGKRDILFKDKLGVMSSSQLGNVHLTKSGFLIFPELTKDSQTQITSIHIESGRKTIYQEQATPLFITKTDNIEQIGMISSDKKIKKLPVDENEKRFAADFTERWYLLRP